MVWILQKGRGWWGRPELAQVAWPNGGAGHPPMHGGHAPPHPAQPERKREGRESEKREQSFFSYAIDEVSRHSRPQVWQPQIEDWAVRIFFADVDGAAGPGCYQLFNMEMSV
jgi:hypothetical protein